MPTPNEPLWEKHYRSHPRNRFYALDDAAKRELETLWFACGQNREEFLDACETFTGSYGLNILRPPSRAEWKPPLLRKNAHGELMPNPYLSPHRNREEQRAIEMVDPELAAHLKASAEHPWSYQLKLDADEAARLRWNAGNESYDHSANPFVGGDKAAQAAFVKQCEENGEPEKLEIYRREALPVSVRLFGKVQDQNRTAIHQIGHDGNERLLKIIERGQESSKARNLEESHKAEAERAAAVVAGEKQRLAHDDLMKGVRRLGDGRIVTMPG